MYLLFDSGLLQLKACEKSWPLICEDRKMCHFCVTEGSSKSLVFYDGEKMFCLKDVSTTPHQVTSQGTRQGRLRTGEQATWAPVAKPSDGRNITDLHCPLVLNNLQLPNKCLKKLLCLQSDSNSVIVLQVIECTTTTVFKKNHMLFPSKCDKCEQHIAIQI